MQSLRDILKSHEKRLPFASGLRANRVCAAARSWIQATWGADVLDLVRSYTYRDGTLSIGVQSAPFAEELRVRELMLSAHLRRALPNSSVRSIRIFVSS